MELVIRSLETDEDAAAFRALNEEWITRYVVDRRQLEDPVRAYLKPGGQILIAELDGQALGCVAIVPDVTGAWELSKMAVAPEIRGRGAGRQLLADHRAGAGTRSAVAVSGKLDEACERRAPLRGERISPRFA